ncbi:MAG: AAA family ATPase [Nitrospira sp.]|nr:AAA family ATPase [bacterium]MBL7048267.1 AAA family ATPase [Nitrospira sp.]
MDHLAFYNLAEHPFSNAVDPRYFYNSTQHSDALIRLKFAVDTMKGLAVVVGDIGTGKTTLARRMLNELDENLYEAALLVVLHAAVTTDWLMKKIAMQLGVENVSDDKIEILGQLYKRLLELSESGLKAVVLMDEVQMLQSREIMEEFRGILNMEGPNGKLINLVLFGLPELDDVLALDEPLKQRVAVKFRLSALDASVTSSYIKHRLHIAGSDEEIFLEDAILAVHEYSGGVPRVINTMCDNAIFEGYLLKQKPITREIIDSVALSLDLEKST